jgi:hypothetical protein
MLYSMDQKFHGDDEKTRESQFWDLAHRLTAIIRPKFQNSNIRHDGILSIRNFMLMKNNHFLLFQLPGNLLNTKKICSLFSWQHAISYLFLYLHEFAQNFEFNKKRIHHWNCSQMKNRWSRTLLFKLCWKIPIRRLGCGKKWRWLWFQ